MPVTVARVESRWLTRVFLFVAGFVFLDAHPAEPLLPTGVVPVAYRIAVAPDLASSGFTGTEEIDVVVKQSTDTVVVNAAALAIDAARLKEDRESKASVSLDEKAGTATLHFPRPLSLGRHTLAITYSGSIQLGRSGMFSAKYDSAQGQKQMLTTQFEFSAARRMFPCWDEPSAKATFTLSATLPANYVAISNMPIAEESAAGADASGVPLKRVTFGTTPRMSSYLLVLVAGELQAVHGQAGKVGLSVWTTGDAQLGQAALERAQKLLPLYGQYFGTNYPLPKLDMIAVPHLGFEAMENWGGITFDSDQLLYDPKSSSSATFQAMRHLVGHEVAHQWFGDLVTNASWNDVWLNESFAEWMSYKATQQLNPDDEPWLNFHAAKKKAMDIDAGPAKSVADNAFDANTSYRKGPAILRMFETYLGEDTFQRGIRDYIQSHAYANATTADLWVSLAKASGKAVAAIAGTFADQPGIPLVEVATQCQSGETVATLTQRRFTVDYPHAEALTWQIPVTLGEIGATPSEAKTVVLGKSPETLRFPGCGKAIKANLGDNGYYHVQYDEADRKRLASSYAELAPADRVNLLTDQWSLARSGDSNIGTYLDLTRQLSNETELVVWTDVLDVLRQIDALERGSPGQDAFRTYARTLLQPLMLRIGWDARTGEEAGTATLRGRIISALGEFDDPNVTAEARRRFLALRKKSVPLSPQLRGIVLEVVGRHADAETYDQLHTLAKTAATPEERRDFYWAMASAQAPALIDRTVEIATTDEGTNGQFPMVLVTAAQRSDVDRLWHDVQQNREKLLGGKISGGLLEAIAEHSFNPDVARSLAADPALAARTSPPGAVRQIEVTAKWRPTVLAGVAEWLDKQKGT